MLTIKIAFIGFGNVARRLVELLLERQTEIAQQYNVRFVCTAIATARYGAVVCDNAMPVATARDLAVIESPPLLERGAVGLASSVDPSATTAIVKDGATESHLPVGVVRDLSIDKDMATDVVMPAAMLIATSGSIGMDLVDSRADSIDVATNVSLDAGLNSAMPRDLAGSSSIATTIAQDIGIDIATALLLVRSGQNLAGLKGVKVVDNSFAAIEASQADIIIETTTLNAESGEPALSHIKLALTRHCHVVTANKGPLAFAAQQLQDLAQAVGRQLRYESTVMDGTPIFNLVKRTLPLVTVNGFRGIVNSTTNFILTAMEQGQEYLTALKEAQQRGIAEADASLDVDGWDAAVKAVVLANCLMDAQLTPQMVVRTGISHLTATELQAANATGHKIRLVMEVSRAQGQIVATVKPVALTANDLLYQVDAFSNALTLETDLMGTLTIFEQNPDLTQTAYGVLSDMISIIPHLMPSKS